MIPDFRRRRYFLSTVGAEIIDSHINYNFVGMLRRLTGVLNRGLLRHSISRNSYLTEMYKAWQANPQSVSEQWHGFFKSYRPSEQPAATASATSQPDLKEKELVLEAFKLIRYYELRGH